MALHHQALFPVLVMATMLGGTDISPNITLEQLGFDMGSVATTSELNASIANTSLTMQNMEGAIFGGNSLSVVVSAEQGMATIINQNTGSNSLIQQSVNMHVTNITVQAPETAAAAP